MSQANLSSFIWSVADLLRGDYKQSDYGKVILPFTVRRRLDCVLEATKEAVLKEKDKRETAGLNPEPFLLKKSRQLFYNTSALDMFYNTGISTYIWILTNRKLKHRRGEVQLIDASAMWQKMRKSLGSKRKELSEDHIAQITKLFGECQEVTTTDASRSDVPISRIFNNTDFGYQTITVERPERDAAGKIAKETKGKGKGKPKPDTSLRDTENVPLSDSVEDYFKREVLPHVPDAWIDHEQTKTGYEIPFIVDEASLLSDLRNLIQTARQRVATVANSTQTMLCWYLGRRLLREHLQDGRAAYGKRILATVSQQLTAEYGDGFTLRSLYRSIQFCQVFPDEAIVSMLSTQLSWSHFMELLPIKDALARDFYAEMCRIERWNVRTFRQKIGKVAGTFQVPSALASVRNLSRHISMATAHAVCLLLWRFYSNV